MPYFILLLNVSFADISVKVFSIIFVFGKLHFEDYDTFQLLDIRDLAPSSHSFTANNC